MVEEKKEDVEVLDIADDETHAIIRAMVDETFVKLSWVIGAAECAYDSPNRLIELKGDESARERFKFYLHLCLISDRNAAVPLDAHSVQANRLDCTVVPVPKAHIGYLNGKNSKFRKAVEAECSALMFFAHMQAHEAEDAVYLLCFGGRKCRRMATLKAMSSVEKKCPRFFTTGSGAITRAASLEPTPDEQKIHGRDDGFGIYTWTMQQMEMSWILGPHGNVRKKLAAAAGCIIEYLEKTAVFCGTLEERERGIQYVQWTLELRNGSKARVTTAGRNDVDELSLPDSSHPPFAPSVRAVERATSTFCMLPSEVHDSSCVLVFGASKENRDNAMQMLRERQDEAQNHVPPPFARTEPVQSRHAHSAGSGKRRRDTEEENKRGDDGKASKRRRSRSYSDDRRATAGKKRRSRSRSRF